MKANFQYDESRRFVSVSYVDANIDSDERFEEWANLLWAGFGRMKERFGGRYPLVVIIDELTIAPEYRTRYGTELAPRVATEFATVIARVGGSLGTRNAVATQALERMWKSYSTADLRTKAYDANLFVDLAEAIQFITAVHAAKCLPGQPEANV